MACHLETFIRFPPPAGVPLDPGIPTKTDGLTNFALDPFGESCDLGLLLVGTGRAFPAFFAVGHFLEVD